MKFRGAILIVFKPKHVNSHVGRFVYAPVAPEA
jgi:hypothetical protein